MIDAQIRMKAGMVLSGFGGTTRLIQSDENLNWRNSGWEFVRPADDDKAAWQLFLPDAPLADTGPKVFMVGQVWATYTGGMPVVWSVVGLLDGRAAPQVLAGFEENSPVGPGSVHALHSVLLFDAPAQQNATATPTNQAQMAPQFYGPGVAAMLNAQTQQQGHANAILTGIDWGKNATCQHNIHPDSCRICPPMKLGPIPREALNPSKSSNSSPAFPRGKDADCTAHGCDRIRELGVYANRAGLCAMHVAQFTRENGGSVHAFDSRHWDDVNWADGIRREMRARPEPKLVVGGLWRTRPEGMR